MIDERDQTYVPLSDRTLRKLDQLERWFKVGGEGYDEDRIVSMALDNMLASIRQAENDNEPAPAKPKGWRGFVARLIGSDHNDDFDPAGVSSVSPSNPTAGFGGEASEPLGAI